MTIFVSFGWLMHDEATQGERTIVVGNDFECVLRIGKALRKDVSVLDGWIESGLRFPLIIAHQDRFPFHDGTDEWPLVFGGNPDVDGKKPRGLDGDSTGL